MQSPEALRSLDGVTERIPIDTSEDETVYLISNGRQHLRLSPTAHFLLQHYVNGTPTEDLVPKLAASMQRDVTVEDITRAQTAVVETVTALTTRVPSTAPGFLVQWILLPARWVRAISHRLKGTFAPTAVRLLLSLVGLAILLAFSLPYSMRFTPSDLVIGYALLGISLFMHEFGHASACAYYGARPSEVGFTLYFIYPALYSNVSDAWHLKRRERVVVDLGGLYFQSIVAAGFVVAYALTNWTPLQAALLMCAGSMSFSLNPILRMDGYWMLADALGVTNLGAQPQRIARHYLRRWQGKPTSPLPWPSWVTRLLLPYTVVSIAVWGLFLAYIFPLLLHYASQLPPVLIRIFAMITTPEELFDASTLWQLVTALYFCFVFVILAHRLLWGRLRWLADKLLTRLNNGIH